MRNTRLTNEALIRRIENDEGLVCKRVIDPCLEAVCVIGGTRGVVRRANVDDVGVHVAVGTGKEPALDVTAGKQDVVCRHDVCVDISRIHGVRNEHVRTRLDDVEEIAQVALGAVGHEDLVKADLNAQAVIEILYRLADKLITLGVIAISAERFGNAHLVHRFVHGLNDAGGEGQRHVSDTESNNTLFGVSLLVGGNLLCNGGKQIALLELAKRRVGLQGMSPIWMHRCISKAMIRYQGFKTSSGY